MKPNHIKSLIILLFLIPIGISAVNAEWVAGGNPVCSEIGGQTVPCMISDGARGAIITWMDGRGNIYAQRINPYGQLIWDSSGVPVCEKESQPEYHRTISDGAGGAFIAWVDSRQHPYTSIYFQRLDGSGGVLWDQDIMAAVPVEGAESRPVLITDGSGGVIVVWEDLRDGPRKIFAQRIDSNGNRLWASEGIKVSDAYLRSGLLQVRSDNAGGAIIAWIAPRDDEWILYAQRINAVGYQQWSDDVFVADGTYMITGFTSASDAHGGIYIAWENADYSPLRRLFAQRIDASGASKWITGGISIFGASPGRLYPRIVSNGTGGVIAVWEVVMGDTYRQYAQRIDSTGVIMWQQNGVEVCYTASYQYGLCLIPDGDGGAISVWSERRHPEHSDIIAQRIDESGDFQWTITGLRTCAALGNQTEPTLLPDGNSGAFIAWQDGRNMSDTSYDIFAVRINSSGNLPPVTMLQSYSAYRIDSDIMVEWTLEQAGLNMDFSIFRTAEPDTVFKEINDLEIIQQGLSFACRDRRLEPSTIYRYRVDLSDVDGDRILFFTDPITTPPMPFTLFQNYPNPFNPSTVIGFYLPESERVVLDVYDAMGQKVMVLINGIREKGRYEVEWNGCNSSGNMVSTGIYFYRLTTGKETISRKMVLLQ